MRRGYAKQLMAAGEVDDPRVEKAAFAPVQLDDCLGSSLALISQTITPDTTRKSLGECYLQLADRRHFDRAPTSGVSHR